MKIKVIIPMLAITISGCAILNDTTGTKNISRPDGTHPIFAKNIDQACNGKIGLKVLIKEAGIEGDCKKEGPEFGMCVSNDWCKNGNSVISPEKIECKQLTDIKPTTANNTPAEDCGKIDGTWHSAGNGITMTIFHNSCSDIRSEFQNHSMRGHLDGERVSYEVIRTLNGCTTIMYGYFDNIQKYTMKSHILGTDGRCDLRTNFEEHLDWKRL